MGRNRVSSSYVPYRGIRSPGQHSVHLCKQFRFHAPGGLVFTVISSSGGNGVHLVYEDYRRGTVPSRCKQTAQDLFAVPAVLAHKRRRGAVEEGGMGHRCDGAGKHRLACPGRPEQQHALSITSREPVTRLKASTAGEGGGRDPVYMTIDPPSRAREYP